MKEKKHFLNAKGKKQDPSENVEITDIRTTGRLESVDRISIGFPALDTIVKYPVEEGFFKFLAENPIPDVQGMGECSTLLEDYFNTVANTLIDGFVMFEQNMFKNIIIYFYNNSAEDIAQEYVKEHKDIKADVRLVIEYIRIFFYKMFISSYYSKGNFMRHPAESISSFEIFTPSLSNTMFGYNDRITNIRYYLLHKENISELALAISSQYVCNLSRIIDKAIIEINASNNTEDEHIAIKCAYDIITDIISRYSSSLLYRLSVFFNDISNFALEVDSNGKNISVVIQREDINRADGNSLPVNFDDYLAMQKKVKKQYINKVVGFVVNKDDTDQDENDGE